MFSQKASTVVAPTTPFAAWLPRTVHATTACSSSNPTSANLGGASAKEVRHG